MPSNIPDRMDISRSNTSWGLTKFVWALGNQSSVEVQAANDGTRVTAAVFVDWEAISRATADFVGFPVLGGDGVNNWIARSIPLAYPDFTDLFGVPFCYAVSCSRIEGVGAIGRTASGAALYNVAKMSLVFSSLTYKIRRDGDPLLVDGLGLNPDESTLLRYVTGPIWKPFSRQITLRRGLLKAVANVGDPAIKNTITEGIGLPEPGAEISYIWHGIPAAAFPILAISQAAGTVNDAQFDIFFPGTLLYETTNVIRHVSAIGDDILDLEHKFKFLPRPDKTGIPQGWNSLLTYLTTSATSFVPEYDYRLYTLDGSILGTPAFRTSSFEKLFRPDQP